jgi:ankyrin repeat protein
VAHALQAAASRHHWAMVRMLLQKDRTAAPAATFAALDAAYAQDPRKPAQLLPRMLDAGLVAHAVDRNGRSVFHWAALRHDLALLRALLERSDARVAEYSLRRPDGQGALPWMYVLRKAELAGQPLSEDAAELLRLLLPPEPHLNFVVTRARPADADALPVGWNAGAAVLNQPAARQILGPDLDFGLLPQDPAAWWKFAGAPEAQAFVRTATSEQLQRAEQPQAPAGQEPKQLSAALAEAGWAQLAQDVQQALQGKRR